MATEKDQERAAKYRAMAKKMIEQAQQTHDEASKKNLLQLASAWIELARRWEDSSGDQGA